MGDKQGHPFRGNQWTPVVGVHPMSPKRLRELKRAARGAGPAAQQAKRQIANMRLPNESAADFVQRQLADEKFLDAREAKRAVKEKLVSKLSEDLAAESRYERIRRASNIEALLVSPTDGVLKPVYGRDDRVVNQNELERAARRG